MSPETVAQTLADAVDEFLDSDPTTNGWNSLLDRLERWYGELDEPDVFHGMLLLLQRRSRFQHQLVAGELLCRRQVPILLPQDEFIRRVATSVDASANTVGHYVGQQIGRTAAVDMLRTIRNETSHPDILSGIDHLRYILGDHPGMG